MQHNLFEDRLRFIESLNLEGEAICNCCNRRARINKAKVNSTLAAMLIRLYVLNQSSLWVHVNDISPGQHSMGRNFCILKHWGLAIPKAAGIDEDKNSSGKWQITGVGKQFVRGSVRICKYAFVLDDKVLKYSDETIDIHQALNEKFSYFELLDYKTISLEERVEHEVQ